MVKRNAHTQTLARSQIEFKLTNEPQRARGKFLIRVESVADRPLSTRNPSLPCQTGKMIKGKQYYLDSQGKIPPYMVYIWTIYVIYTGFSARRGFRISRLRVQ
jgi:hypothetical protein